MSINIKQNLSEGYDLFTEWTFPLGHCFQKLQKKAIDFPKLSLVLVAIMSFFLSFLRLITFPLLCTIGVISIPFIVIIKKIQNENVSKWIIAWSLNLLSLAIIVSILFTTTAFAPIPAIFITLTTAIFLSVSITCIQINHSLYRKNNFFIKN